ncbi:F-box protein SKIP1-like [Asparagus officinalis]|uniref:F-box protein SKIP1-like n=1 Tax=Asparagus officinalis TaxID=4686 RepID=UPI00098E2EAD|nr:F-box protein SKIP1-like [Asparagus officinalis]
MDGKTATAGAGEDEPRIPPEQTRDWSDLTPVLLVNAFRRLSLRDRWAGAMLTCKSWLEASKDSSLFSSLDLEPYFDAAGSGSGDLIGWWTAGFERRIDSMIRSVADWGAGSVREVRVRHCSDGSISLLAERSPKLEVLSIQSSQSVTDASISRIALSCSMLRELDISNCYEISYKSLETIGDNCPNLTILRRNFMNWLDPSQHTGIVPDEYLRNCPQDGDMEATAIARAMPKLKHLELRFSKLTAAGLISVSEGCQELEVLDLFGCVNLTSRGIEQSSANLKNLIKLIKPNFYIPRSVYHTERYGHWRLYDERFQTNVFQI